MRTSPRVIGVAACGLALLVSGCTSSSADPDEGGTESASAVATPSPSPSSSDDPSPTASASPKNPFAVPDPVTEEYVDRVVNTLYEEWGAITREILQKPADPTGITDVETRERIAALFDGQYLRRRFEEADGFVRGDRSGVLPAGENGQIRFAARRIFFATEKCLIAAGDFDTEETAVEPDTTLAALSLARAKATGSNNPTGWRILDLVPNTSAGEPMAEEVMLEASPSDFEDVLTHSCEEEPAWEG